MALPWWENRIQNVFGGRWGGCFRLSGSRGYFLDFLVIFAGGEKDRGVVLD